MASGEIVSGQQRNWTLLEKIGEGDAGEVYLVESLLDRSAAILKRPRRSSFSNEVIRQAAQIDNEGRVLRALAQISPAPDASSASPVPRVQAPRLLDQSQSGSEFSERLFIIIEKASGYDLASLARLARHGSRPDGLSADSDNLSQFYLDQVQRLGQLPRLMLLRTIAGLLQFLATIHRLPVRLNGIEKSGILWNDAKPDHLFWDPFQGRLTVVDWGNAQFLEADGATKDRRFSLADDEAQFIVAIGRYLNENAPELYRSLEWPSEGDNRLDLLEVKLLTLLQPEYDNLRSAHRRAADLLQTEQPRAGQLEQLQNLHDQILAEGELPDFAHTEAFYTRLGAVLVKDHRLQEAGDLCALGSRLPGAERGRWSLVEELCRLTLECPIDVQPGLEGAIAACLAKDWPSALWELLNAPGLALPPARLEELVQRIRLQQGEIDPGLVPPFVLVNRFTHTLRADFQRREDALHHRQTSAESAETEGLSAQLQSYEQLLRVLREEVLHDWRQTDPDPPFSSLEYTDVNRIIDAIGEYLPDAKPALLRSLNQAQAHVNLLLEAWKRLEFETAARRLRQVLFWDPDRLRVFEAERTILATPGWLAKVRRGPNKGEPLVEFATRVELTGRDIRQRVGPARWLDLLIESFMLLRKGAKAADLLEDHPELLNDLPWLEAYTPRRAGDETRLAPLALERLVLPATPQPTVRGQREGALGFGQELHLVESLDTWAAEARGSSARVFSGMLRTPSGEYHQAAIKLARPDRLDYALPLFREEARILMVMQAVPGVNRLLECGYLRLDAVEQISSDETDSDARALKGSVLRYGLEELPGFLLALESRMVQGWLPYLALEKRERGENLMWLCDAGHLRGNFRPIKETLRLGIQICEILQAAHARNVVYRDHKLLHYYWVESQNGVFVIDWNVARLHPQGLSQAEKQFDLVQFGARALHHILTGRPAPGALPAGPNRPEEIEAAARSYAVEWTFDDQRLARALRETIERVLIGDYTSAADLRSDLLESFHSLPEAGN
jgi:serine/threonine protein kinase